ncbi:Adenine nucleotide alpha hydrolases-like protein [Dioscorea alata]|uniref:Adenine nucleotide alpha hydrolases-like protein n=1 Tax=Dioscorea alata TaxID=55571 RepID=A0ACB7WQV4_DIOAL|nr:Adenine nucleotide alpha hydrolases-like protein [Dioscorea alata]
MENQGAGGKRLVVVVADPGRESAGALQWALSHAVLEQDDIILLHVEPMNARKTTTLSFLRRQAAGSLMESGGGGGEYYEFLYSMKAECKRKQPKVKVQIERVEMMGDKDKAITILTHADVLGAGLLVIGQRRSSGTFIGRKLSETMSMKGNDIADYLIENSKCLCVGVQKKGQNGGYVLSTKTHKNFWLLA